MTMRAVLSGLPQDRVPPDLESDSLERLGRRGPHWVCFAGAGLFLCALGSSRFWGGRALFFTRDSFRPLTHP
jgi:hypothetical protein